jgi:hypothetical protein
MRGNAIWPRNGSRASIRRIVLGTFGTLLLTTGLASAYTLFEADQALADSASITVTTTSGQPDPAAGVPRIFSAVGDASVPERIYVKYRAIGGAPCAPDAESDSGSVLEYPFFNNWAWNEEVNGSFNIQKVFTWEPPGTFMFCVWLAESAGTIATPITQTITFRAPVGTISATVNPATPQPGQSATVTITGSSESPEQVFAKIRATGGAPCAPTFEADSGQSLVYGQEVNGSFSTQTTTQQSAGTYLICLWLASSPNDPHPVAGPQPETFTVATPAPPPPPPPPCVVPALSANVRLASIERRIQSAHCRVGRIRYTHNKRRKGSVVGLRPGPHVQLPSGSAIEILASDGPRPRLRRHRR